MFENQIKIKSNPELRHVLAHMVVAMQEIIDGHPLSAEENLRSIESVLFYEDEEHELESLKRKERSMAKKSKPRPRPKPSNPCNPKK